MQKVPDLVVLERMSQVEKTKCAKEEEEESERMVHRRNEEQSKQSFGRRRKC